MRWEILTKIPELSLLELYLAKCIQPLIDMCRGKRKLQGISHSLPHLQLTHRNATCDSRLWTRHMLMTCSKINRPFSPEPLNFISNHVKLSHVCSLAGDATVIKIHPAKIRTHKSVNNYITSEILFLWYRHYQTVTGNLTRVFARPPFRVPCLFFELYRK